MRGCLRENERLGVRDTSIDNSVLLQVGMVAKLQMFSRRKVAVALRWEKNDI